MLKMKAGCERCAGLLPPDTSAAYICSFECTFCEVCATSMNRVCPTAAASIQRPKRTRSLASAAGSQLAGRLRRLVGRGG